MVLIHPNSAAKLVDYKTDLAGRIVTVLGGKRGAFLFIFDMSQSDAPTLVGELLIQVISESNNEPSEPNGTPALFTPRHRHPPWPART